MPTTTSTAASSGRFPMIGSHRCIDFINTEILEQGRRVELLGTFADLVDWLQETQVLGATQAKQLLHQWGPTSEGARALAEARAFRQLLRQMVEGIVGGERPSARMLHRINVLLRCRTGEVSLVRTRHGIERRVSFAPREPIHLLVPVADSASELLCHGDLTLIRKCQNPRCILYFYDTTKNHTRRWCSMSVCGNRMKVAAHHRRRRGKAVRRASA
jgi:predicted RNA-binding Zn ribbon-like protein